MTGQRISAEQSFQAQRRAAGALRKRGLRNGDRVAVVAAPSADYLAVAIGALRVGIVPVLLNPTLVAAEQETLLRDAAPALTLRDADLAEICSGPSVDLADYPLSRPMLFTSGTTGRPKGVWSGVWTEDEARSALLEEREVWGFDKRDVHMVVSPLHHSAPLRFATGTLLAGGSVIVAGPFDAEKTAAVIAQEKPTTAFMVPAHLQRFLSLPEIPSLDSFRLLMHAGAPCPEGLKRRTMSVFPNGTVWEFYGSTEGQFTVCSPEDWLQHPGSVGRVRKHRKIEIDKDGLIWCQVPPYARFVYWHDAAKTRRAWRKDRFSVGDLGRMSEDGFLYLDGRRDDLIISGGVNVYPVEIERTILSHPEVHTAAVFPVEDERWGQMVCAAVVGNVSEEAMRSWLRERLAPYKRPKLIIHVDTIPVSATGKVRRSLLATQLGVASAEEAPAVRVAG